MSIIHRFVQNDQGGETLDYAMVLGLVSFGCLAAVTATGGSVSGWWDEIRESFRIYFATG